MIVLRLSVLVVLTAAVAVLCGCTPPPPDPDAVTSTGPTATGATFETITTTSSGDRDDAKTASVAERLHEPGRWTALPTPPVMPDPTAGRNDQLLGARGSAGTRCINGQPTAWLTTSAEHFLVDDAAFFRDTALSDTMTGGVVRLVAITAAGDQTMIEYVVPGEDGPVKFYYDLERTDGLREHLAAIGQYLEDPILANLGTGDLAAIVATTNPTDGDEIWFRTFEIFAPELPLPTDTTQLALTYTLNDDLVSVDLPVAVC